MVRKQIRNNNNNDNNKTVSIQAGSELLHKTWMGGG